MTTPNTNLTLLERCACGAHLELDEEPHRGHIVTCPRCFDPSAEDATPIERLAGVGATPADAFANYMRLREERDLEPDYRLSELATFIVPPAPEGFALVARRWDAALGEYTYPTTLDAAEALSAWTDRIHYGPAEVQKAANQ